MHKHPATVALAALMIVAPYTASAAAQLYDSGSAATAQKASTTQYGLKNATSLAFAFTHNAPLGWELRAPNTLKDTQVRWPHNTQWLNSLDAVGHQHGIIFEVNMQDKYVQARRKHAITRIPSSATHHALTWRITKGKSLRENLEDWTKQAGWNLIWSAYVDYPIVASATIAGDSFEDAVKELAQTMKYTKAPLNFKISSNKVLRVSGGAEWGK